MSAYVDRTGQQIGPWAVMNDAGRTRRGKVIWRLRHEDGRVKHLKTWQVIALAKAHHVPRPSVPGWAAGGWRHAPTDMGK